MNEQKNERVALHFLVSDIDDVIAFYSGALGFKCIKDTVLAVGGRWAAVAKTDNTGVQLHFHRESTEGKPNFINEPISIEFSHPDVSGLRRNLESKDIPHEIWDCPWGCGLFVSDPFGNELNFSEYF